MRMLNSKRIVIEIGVLLAAAVLTGCGGGGGGSSSSSSSSDTEKPVISSASATSPSDSDGGTVTITATATDNIAVKSVKAVVTDPDDVESSVTLSAGSSNTWSGTYTADENGEQSDVTYTVVVTAKDAAGNTDTEDCTFEVPGEAPPPVPEIE